MEIVKLTAEPRSSSGKGPARRLRADGKIPAVAYGLGSAPVTLTVSPKELKAVLNGAYGKNSVLEIEVTGGQGFTAMVRDYSYHPVSRNMLHADLLRVDMDKAIDVEVTFRTTGRSKGVVLGGTLQQVYRTLPVRCRPADIPPFVEIDVTELQGGESIKASDLQMPEGVTIRLPGEKTVVTVHALERKADEAAEDKGDKKAAAKAEKPAKKK